MNGDDEALVARLRELAARADPPPAHLADAARAAFAWRTVDRELARLAELAYDSAIDEHVLAGVRGESEQRMLTFDAGDVAVEVEVSGTASRRRLVGQIVPGQPGRVEVRQPGGVQVVDADPLGRFGAVDVRPGPLSLRCHLGTGRDARVVDTEWLPI